MIRNKKAMLFCSQIILTGALLTGAPCLASGSEPELTSVDTTESVFGSADTENTEPDHSGEGQIHKPESLEAPVSYTHLDGRCIKRLAFSYGNRIKDFQAIMEHMHCELIKMCIRDSS